jgi:anti-sigma factor RsiW
VTELHESTGSFAVDALDPAERTEFEDHLASCAACQREVADFRETAAELALLSQADPPPSLRDSIMAAIQNIPRLAAENGAGAVTSMAPFASRPAESTGRGPRRALPGSEPTEKPEPMDELAERRQRRRTRVLSGLVAAMLALAVGLGGVVYTLVQQRQAQIAQTTLEQQLYAAPDAVQVSNELPGGGQVTFVASKQLNRAVFIGTDLPDPGQDRYQLWTGTGNPTVPEEITGLTRDNQIADTGSGVKVFFSGNVANSDFLAVNLEPAGSTPAEPTNDVLVAAPI